MAFLPRSSPYKVVLLSNSSVWGELMDLEERVSSTSSTPVFSASSLSAPTKSRFSIRMMKANASPPAPQPKHFQRSSSGQMQKDGVFSAWNGQQAHQLRPDFLSAGT